MKILLVGKIQGQYIEFDFKAIPFKNNSQYYSKSYISFTAIKVDQTSKVRYKKVFTMTCVSS